MASTPSPCRACISPTEPKSSVPPMRGLSDRHRFRKGATARRSPAQKKPFVGGAGTYEGRQGEGAHPSRTLIIDHVFQKLNPSNGGSSKFLPAPPPSPPLLWGGPAAERRTATFRRSPVPRHVHRCRTAEGRPVNRPKLPNQLSTAIPWPRSAAAASCESPPTRAVCRRHPRWRFHLPTGPNSGEPPKT